MVIGAAAGLALGGCTTPIQVDPPSGTTTDTGEGSGATTGTTASPDRGSTGTPEGSGGLSAGSGSTAPASGSTTDPTSTGAEPDPPATCDEQYGGAPEYILCMETETECHFNAQTNGTCEAMCAMFGGRCLDAFDNPNILGQECEIILTSNDDCQTVRGTELCVCSR